jgi:hypothetical protein
MLETLLPGVRHLQNIHPLVVHFPIAFLTGAALLYFLALGVCRRTPKNSIDSAHCSLKIEKSW